MRPAVLLGVAALLAAGGVNAQILNPADIMYQDQQMLIYAQETMAAAGATTLAGDPVPYATVKVPSGALRDVDLRMRDFVFKQNAVWYLRLDFKGFRMKSGHIGAYWADTDTAEKRHCIRSTRRRGTWIGNNRDGRAAAYQLTGYSNFDGYHNWCIIVEWEDARDSGDVVQLQPGYATVRASLYETPAAALHGDPDQVILESSEMANISELFQDRRAYTVRAAQRMAFVGPAMRSETVPFPATTASVERGFAAFLPRSGNAAAGDPGSTAERAALATVTATANHVQRTVQFEQTVNRFGVQVNPAGAVDFAFRHAGTGAELTAATAAQLVQSARVDIKGDFADGTFLLSGAATSSCPRGGALNLNEDKTVASATYTGGASCLFVQDAKASAENEAAGKDFDAIKGQKFTADIDITPAVASQWPPAKRSDLAAGEIKRDGTTVQLPYLTTRPGYAQRLVVVNRGPKPADFWVENVSSADGTSPTAKATAATPMNVGAESRTSVAVSALVDLGTGGTEGAATLSVNAAQRNVDIATVLTNLASNSTDTLPLAPMAEEAVAATPPDAGSGGGSTQPPDAGSGGGSTQPPPVARNCAIEVLDRGFLTIFLNQPCDHASCCNRGGSGTCVTPGAGNCTQ